MKMLEVEHLTKSYSGFTLDDVCFSLNKGGITGFIGRNGAGKSTTLKAIMNIIHPDKGRITVLDKQLGAHELEIKRQIGFVSGGINYYQKKRLRTITATTSSFYPNWDEQAYNRYLHLFQLDEAKTVEELSAGMRVKYALTLALSHNAELLILDEPTSGLDPVSRDDLLDIFLDLSNEGKTILFSTHITSDIDKCADDIIYIRRGRILAQAPLGEYLASYRVVELTADQLTPEIAPLLIGCKKSKHGYRALIESKNTEAVPLISEPADLENIMIHMEKETPNETVIE